LKTTDGGNHWILQSTGVSSYIASIQVLDAENDWGSGENVVLKTTNGGETWSQFIVPQHVNARKIFFASSELGWAIGTEIDRFDSWGVIAGTTDGGETWIPQKCPTHHWLADVFFIDDKTGWIVGIGGTILKTTNGGGITNVSGIKSGIPKTCSLSQNYPNPFNCGTIIGYTLSSCRQVHLRVYDMLGREVRTLANGMQEAGYHKVQFDARGLASGVYFYQLQAGDYIEAKKLILLQ